MLTSVEKVHLHRISFDDSHHVMTDLNEVTSIYFGAPATRRGRHGSSSKPPSLPLPSPKPRAAASSSSRRRRLSLDRLIAASARALSSLSALLPPNPPVGSDLAACPSNAHHRMPPESLFRHYLTCPAPLDLGSSLQSLGNPRTSESSDDNPPVRLSGRRSRQRALPRAGWLR
ncbi:hypothetical protein NL676_020519 [Syzygium grande]|nr:hypothetical protein NL676_020519 [Syzygium grande]